MRHVRRTIPALAFRVLRVDLDELCEVATVAQRGRNRAHLGQESIGADLEALRAGSSPQAYDNGVRGRLVSTSQSPLRPLLPDFKGFGKSGGPNAKPTVAPPSQVGC
jgi:hypothetical protein